MIISPSVNVPLAIETSNRFVVASHDLTLAVVLLDDPEYFDPDYNTNCRLEYTKRCLPDLGNSTLRGKELGTGKTVSISPNNFDT